MEERLIAFIIWVIVGGMLISIGAMIAYTVGIESKYRKRK